MYERLYVTESKLRVHLDSPLLKERRVFLEKNASMGKSKDRLRILASYILYATHALHLHDGENDTVPIEDITKVSHDYQMHHSGRSHKACMASKLNEFADVFRIIYSWLFSLKLLEPKFMDKDSIFYRLFTSIHFRFKYIAAPHYEERKRHLETLEKDGMPKAYIREYAEQQLNVIKQFKLDQGPIGHSFSTDEIIDAARCFGKLSNKTSVHSRYQRFRAVCMSWFSFMEVITGKEKSYPGSNYVDMFCEWHLTSKGSSVGATVHIRQELDRFFAYINSKSVTINLLTADCIDGYIETYQSACFSRKTVASKVSILRTFLRYLYNRSIIKTDMSSYLISPRIYTCEILPASLNENDLNRISHFYDGNTPSAIRNKAILLLLIEYGMRSGEVASLRLSDIDWERDVLYLHREKGHRKQQVLTLKANVGNAILRYIKEVRCNERGYREVFLKLKNPVRPMTPKGIYHVVSNAIKGLCIHVEHVGPHSLRRAFATIRINKGHTFKDIADILGHRQLDTTRIYAKVDLKSLRQVSDINWEGIL